MRKALLVFALVAFLATGTVFAELTGVGEPTVSGSVSTTFGYDLDDEASGFVNDSSLTLTLPLLDGSMTKGGDDGMYGEITVDEIGWQLNNDGFYDVDEDADAQNTSELDASISAKLVLNDFFVGLGQPDFDFNNVDIDDSYAVDVNPDAAADTGGLSLGFMNDLVTFELFLASEGDYRNTLQDGNPASEGDDDATDEAPVFDNDIDPDDNEDTELFTPNTDNNYVVGGALTLTPMEGVSVPVNFLYDADYSGTDALVAFGAAPSLTVGPATIDIPVDYAMIGDITGFEANPAVSADAMENLNIALDFLFGTYENLTVAQVPNGVPGEDPIADLSLTVTDSGAFVEGLANTVEFSLTNIMDEDATGEMGWDVDVDTSYTTGGLMPYVNFGYGDNEVFDLGVGVEMAAAFTGLENTVMTLDYSVEDLTDKDTEAYANEKGRVTFDVTVSF